MAFEQHSVFSRLCKAVQKSDCYLRDAYTVCLPVCIEHHDFHLMHYGEISYVGFLVKFVNTFRFLKLVENDI